MERNPKPPIETKKAAPPQPGKPPTLDGQIIKGTIQPTKRG